MVQLPLEILSHQPGYYLSQLKHLYYASSPVKVEIGNPSVRIVYFNYWVGVSKMQGNLFPKVGIHIIHP